MYPVDEEMPSFSRVRRGVAFDVALWSCTPPYAVAAVHAVGRRIRAGKDFFREISVPAVEVKFALAEMRRNPGVLVMIPSGVGAVLLSGYYDLSVQMGLAVIPEGDAECLAYAAATFFGSHICVSPSLASAAARTESLPGDEAAYETLDGILSLLRDACPSPVYSETVPAHEAVRNAYRTAHAMAEVCGVSLSLACPFSTCATEVRYDPVVGSLYFFVFFCYAGRKANGGEVTFSVKTDVPNPVIDATAQLPVSVTESEATCLQRLRRYPRQLVTVVERGGRVHWLLSLSQIDRPEWAGLKADPLAKETGIAVESDLTV